MLTSRPRTLLCLVVCCFSLSPSAIRGQEPVRRVSLDEALEEFAEHSLALKIARAEAARVSGAARQSRAYANPAFSFGRDDLAHGDETFWEEAFSISQPVEWPGRTAARGRAAEHAIDAATAGFRGDSIELAFAVREAYVRAWFAEESERFVGLSGSVIQAVAEDAEIRFDAGDISAFEARRLRLERVQAEQQMAEAALASRDARRQLAVLITSGSGTREVGPSDGVVGLPPVVARESALQSLPLRPDLEVAARELDAARAAQKIAETYAIPEPTLGIGYRHQLDGLGGARLALDVPLPFFDRGTATRDEATARSLASSHRLDLRTRLARYDLVAAFDRYASRRSRLAAVATGLVADGEALLASANAAYAELEMSLLELLDAAGAFQDAQLSALALRSDAWIAYFDLLRAMGGAPDG